MQGKKRFFVSLALIAGVLIAVMLPNKSAAIIPFSFVKSSAFRSLTQQEAYVKASNTDISDGFTKVAYSSDGKTMAVSATGEDSNATGIDGEQGNNGAATAGAVYVFTRNGSTWSQQAYIKAPVPGPPTFGDGFGGALALSGDGNTLVVTTENEDSDATGIGGDDVNNNAGGAGAAFGHNA